MTTETSAPPPHVDAAQRWRDTNLSALDRAIALAAQLTLEEKAAQLGSIWQTDTAGDFAPQLDEGAARTGTGDTAFPDGLGQLTRVFGSEPVTVAEGVRRLRELQSRVISSQRLGIPALAHEECLTGLAAFGATAFPTPLAWAATFDEALVERMARAIGDDMRSLGIHQGLAPVLDVVKDYRWGRVEETMGEDPYVVGQLGAAYVRGLEEAGIIATLKHFAGYSASRGARNHAPVSMGPRELADTILPPFETALRLGGARSVMTSYTDIDGIPSTANAHLLETILRDSWGFEGTVVADYWAIPFLSTMHHVAPDNLAAGALALRAGVDVELPQTLAYASLAELVRQGTVSESDLDRAVVRHLRQKIDAGLLDGDPVPADAESVDLDGPRNRQLSSQIAESSLVLLRDDGVLPLTRRGSIALVGAAATQFRSLIGCYAFPNHVLTKHPGHELGIAIPTVEDALRAEFPEAEISSIAGCEITGDDRSGIAEAVALARASEVAVVVVGDIAGLFGDGTSGEGCDVADLRLPGSQHELVTAVIATGVPTVVIVTSGRPYALGDYDGSSAIVQAFFPGADGAAAIAGLLSGRVEPSGRLPVQIPRHPGSASTYLQPTLGRHNAGITALDPTPLFPFGFGVTRGEISYTAIRVDREAPTDGTVEVEVVVHNSGRTAVEVVQLYAAYPTASTVRPDVQLIGYARIEIPSEATATVTFSVDTGTFAVTGADGVLAVEPGHVVLAAGPSAADRPVHADLELTGRHHPLPQRVVRTPWSASIIDHEGAE